MYTQTKNSLMADIFTNYPDYFISCEAINKVNNEVKDAYLPSFNRMIHSIKNKAEEQKEKFLADHNDQDISSVLAGRRWNNELDSQIYREMIDSYLYGLAIKF